MAINDYITLAVTLDDNSTFSRRYRAQYPDSQPWRLSIPRTIETSVTGHTLVTLAPRSYWEFQLLLRVDNNATPPFGTYEDLVTILRRVPITLTTWNDINTLSVVCVEQVIEPLTIDPLFTYLIVPVTFREM